MKKLNRKFRNYFLLAVVILSIVMIIFQFLSIRKITNNFYSEYAEDVLQSKKNLVQYWDDELITAMDLISEINLDDEVYVKEIIEGYLIYNTFTDVFVFDENNRNIYLSSEKYGNNYEEIITNIYDDSENIDYQDMFYSRNTNSFVWFREGQDSENNNEVARFLFLNDNDIFEKKVVNDYDSGHIYVINKDGTVFYPQNYSNKIDFNFENCFESKNIKYDGVIKYRKDILQNICVFWIFDSEMINQSININYEVIIIFSTVLIAFFAFLFLFYVLREEFE